MTDPEDRRRMARVAEGKRRFSLGRGSWSPFSQSAGGDAEADLGQQITQIERALGDVGETSRTHLSQLVGAKYWRPGSFRRALGTAVAEGRVRKTGRRIYAPPQSDSG